MGTKKKKNAKLPVNNRGYATTSIPKPQAEEFRESSPPKFDDNMPPGTEEHLTEFESTTESSRDHEGEVADIYYKLSNIDLKKVDTYFSRASHKGKSDA